MTITPIRPKWKGTLTDRERFNRQMHYQPLDRMLQHGVRLLGGELQALADLLRKRHHQERGGRYVLQLRPLRQRSAAMCGSPLPFPTRLSKMRETTRVLMNEDGLFAEVPRDGHDTIPHYIKATIVTPDDWKKVKAERFRLRRSRSQGGYRSAQEDATRLTAIIRWGCGWAR